MGKHSGGNGGTMKDVGSWDGTGGGHKETPTKKIPTVDKAKQQGDAKNKHKGR